MRGLPVRAFVVSPHGPAGLRFRVRRGHQLCHGIGRAATLLARALVLRPRFLILDETTSSLDTSMQARILRLLIGVRAEWAPSCVLVTHDFALVRQVADRVVVLDKGRVVDLGTVDKVFSDPRPKTRELLESSKLDGRK